MPTESTPAEMEFGEGFVAAALWATLAVVEGAVGAMGVASEPWPLPPGKAALGKTWSRRPGNEAARIVGNEIAYRSCWGTAYQLSRRSLALRYRSIHHGKRAEDDAEMFQTPMDGVAGEWDRMAGKRM
jgi:hypothetical protein